MGRAHAQARCLAVSLPRATSSRYPSSPSTTRLMLVARRRAESSDTELPGTSRCPPRNPANCSFPYGLPAYCSCSMGAPTPLQQIRPGVLPSTSTARSGPSWPKTASRAMDPTNGGERESSAWTNAKAPWRKRRSSSPGTLSPAHFSSVFRRTTPISTCPPRGQANGSTLSRSPCSAAGSNRAPNGRLTGHSCPPDVVRCRR